LEQPDKLLSNFQDKGRENESPGINNTSLNFIRYLEDNLSGMEVAVNTRKDHFFLLITNFNLMATSKNVIPSKAGIQNPLISLDSGRSLSRT